MSHKNYQVQSGRTANQLAQALAAARNGRTVIYLVKTKDMVRYMSHRLQKEYGSNLPYWLEVQAMDHENFDWDAMCPKSEVDIHTGRCRNPDRVYIVDHSVAEEALAYTQRRMADMQLRLIHLARLADGETQRLFFIPKPPVLKEKVQ